MSANANPQSDEEDVLVFQSALNAICPPISLGVAKGTVVQVSIRFKRDMSANNKHKH